MGTVSAIARSIVTGAWSAQTKSCGLKTGTRMEKSARDPLGIFCKIHVCRGIVLSAGTGADSMLDTNCIFGSDWKHITRMYSRVSCLKDVAWVQILDVSKLNAQSTRTRRFVPSKFHLIA